MRTEIPSLVSPTDPPRPIAAVARAVVPAGATREGGRAPRGRLVLEETVTNTKRDRDIQRHLVVVLVISSYSVLTPDRIAIKKKFLSIRNWIIIICPICA